MSDELLQEIQGHPCDPRDPREIADRLKNMGAEESAAALERLPVKVAAAAAQNVGARPAGEIFRRMEPAAGGEGDFRHESGNRLRRPLRHGAG